MQNMLPLSPAFICSNELLDLEITHNFSCPCSIKTLNDPNSDHLPVILSYWADSYDLELNQSIFTDLHQLTFMLDKREIPPVIPKSKQQTE